MKKTLLIAIGLSLAGGAMAQAQPMGPAQGPPPMVSHDQDNRGQPPMDRHDDRGGPDRDHQWRGHHRHHRGHTVCFRRHHHRVCEWRAWHPA
jgi:Ni/Co efflux regulator RcnB